jgi:hypothetical protein
MENHVASKTTRAAVWCAMTVALAGGSAHATHPDYEGEKGLELSLLPGFGGAFTHDEGVFLPAERLPRPESGAPFDSFGASVGGDLAVGWRFAPFVSAGLRGGYQSLTTANVFASSQAAYMPQDSIGSFHVGVYGRVYPMSFFNGSQHNPRVFFDSATDRRRFEPWLSLGVEFAQYRRHRTYNDVTVMDSYSTWTTSYVGIPIGVGMEYRILQPLAVGLSFTVTPLVGGGTSEVLYNRTITPGSDTTMQVERSYDPAAASNVAFSAALNVRYTFTLGQ